MNPLIQLQNVTPVSVVALVLTCFCISPGARAVTPAPDGGYAGNNTAEGNSALLSLTTGVGNTAVGFAALSLDKTGSSNTAVGDRALRSTTAGGNTAIGVLTLGNNISGFYNVACGFLALAQNSTGFRNTAIGNQALFDNKSSGETAIGDEALFHNTAGTENTAAGFRALFTNDTGLENSAFGYRALAQNNTDFNTAVGAFALENATAGSNTAVGAEALHSITSGSSNTAVGSGALAKISQGSNNIAVGQGAGSNVTNASDSISIGVPGLNSTGCYIGQIWSHPGGTQAVYVSSLGQLGFVVSSRRFKDEIKPIDKVSEAIYALKPVSFRYKAEIEPTRPVSFGLVAEDAQKVCPDLVLRSPDGKPVSVRYDAVNTMLLNEFLKEHGVVQEQSRKIEELETTIANLKSFTTQQQKEMQALASDLAKVSSELKLSRPAPQTLAENW